MRSFGLIAAVFLAVVVSSCGGNSTTIGVTVSPIGHTSAGSAIPVIEGQTQTFFATVSGGSATTVYWQICLPVPPTNPPTQPTMCTPIPGITSSATATINGYGTITQNGVYTAPTSLPQQNPFLIVAVSTVNLKAFGTAYVQVDPGIRIQMIPSSATIGTGETFTVTASVTGTTNTAVTWSVNSIVGGNSLVGTIQPGGSGCPVQPVSPGQNCATFVAPTSAESATILATSSANPSTTGTATITVSSAANATLTSIDPTAVEQGSAQQDIYVTGTNFFSTSTVQVNGTAVPTTWISSTLMRATIPSTSLTQAGPVPIQIQRQNGDVSGSISLPVTTVRPAVVASSPDSVAATGAGFGVSLTGGFFASAVTTATFDGFPGTSTGVGGGSIGFSSSRQMTVNIPAGGLSTPGLYPIVVQNAGVTTGSSTAWTNLAVTPPAGTLLNAPIGPPVPVGSNPSAISVDEADGLAVVVNTGSNSVSIINLVSNSVVQTLAVGNSPTGVAIDDGLLAPLDPIAVVANSADNTISTIDLKTFTVSPPVALPPPPTPQTGAQPSEPYSIGINPVTHRGVVANTSTDLATILDTSTGAPMPPSGATQFPQIGGTQTNYGTGPQPQISIDPRLNWAVVTAGGGGVGNANFVDLGRNAIPGVDPGRQPSFVGSLILSTTGTLGVTGVGINPETHQVLLTLPSLGNFTMFSLLNQVVSTISFTNQGVTVNERGYVAAAVSALPNIGVAVNSNSNSAAILDLQNHLVIENVTVGNRPVAVAIDPALNEALVVNQADGTVSVLSLGAVLSTSSPPVPQITLSSPEITFTSGPAMTLTVNGGGFATGAPGTQAQVFLDGTPLSPVVPATSRQIVATVPGSMLASARRYAVYVENPGQSVISNIEDLTVIQAVSVGAQPFGVAIDTDCDVAAVTNSGDSTVSIVALTANSAPPVKTCVNASAVGVVGSAVPVGAAPEGIALDPRLSLAVVANNGSNNVSVVDVTETNPPSTIAICGGSCTSLTGVAINQDNSNAQVTAVLTNTSGMFGEAAAVSLPSTSIPASATAGGGIASFFVKPTGIAVDPYLGYFGVSIAGQNQPSAVQTYNIQQATTQTSTAGFALPTGIVFDPVNQVFVVANSLENNISFVDPVSGIASFSQVGMNPTALDYNFQTSTLVTANNASQTMSILDYVCPPTIATNCSAPLVRSILPLGGSPQFSVAIDPKLNLAVLADQNNNRVLLIPLP